MENDKQFKLIEGIFSAADAKFLILTFFNDKISFHNRELLAMQLKNPGNTTAIEAKLAQLEDSKNQFLAYLEANISFRSFRIKGTIDIAINE